VIKIGIEFGRVALGLIWGVNIVLRVEMARQHPVHVSLSGPTKCQFQVNEFGPMDHGLNGWWPSHFSSPAAGTGMPEQRFS
jgi:hypothetical protein